LVTDKAEKLYQQRNKTLLGPDVNNYSVLAFGLALSPLMLFALPLINLLLLVTPIATIILAILGIKKSYSVVDIKTQKIPHRPSFWFGLSALILGVLQLLLIILAIGVFSLSTILVFNYLFV
jgi:uncharacterized membrane protein